MTPHSSSPPQFQLAFTLNVQGAFRLDFRVSRPNTQGAEGSVSLFLPFLTFRMVPVSLVTQRRTATGVHGISQENSQQEAAGPWDDLDDLGVSPQGTQGKVTSRGHKNKSGL